MLDQWLEQCGVSFRKASLIRDKKKERGPGLPPCLLIYQAGPDRNFTAWPLFSSHTMESYTVC